MNHQLAMRRLWWKETRQLMPLALMLFVISLVAHLLMQLQDDPIRSLLLIGMPLLFSIGAGALLVGQEKELGTLEWLTNLPIAARDIVRVKFSVSMLGLVAMWALSYGMFVAFRLLDDSRGANFQLGTTPKDYLVFTSQTFFILLIGLYLAWQFRSALLSLVLLVPIAVIPGWIAGDPSSNDSWHVWFLSAVGAGTLLAGVFGWRAALNNLSAAPAMGGPVPAEVSSKTPEWGPPQSPTSALLWQFGRQSLGWLGLAFGLTLLMVIGLCRDWMPTQGVGAVLSLLILISTSWLGTSAFVGDRVQDRIRFLADRGISPSRVWLTRHALPVCLMSLMALAFAVALSQMQAVVLDDIRLFAITFGVFGLVYVTSQWVGQLIRSPVIATLAAPAVAGLAIWAAVMSVQVLGTPVWLIALVGILPLAATWCLMSRWMDGHWNLGYWLAHGGFVCAGLCLWLAPLLQPLMQPGMPASIQSEIEAYAAEQTVMSPGRRYLPPMSSFDEESIYRAPPLQDQLRSHLRATHEFVRYPYRVHSSDSQLVTEARRLRWALGDDPSPEMIADYRLSIETLCLLTQRLRASERLVEQDEAGYLSGWLQREANQPEAEELWTLALIDQATPLWEDQESQKAALLRAIALSWLSWQANASEGSGDVGGYWMADQLPRNTFRQQLTSDRRIGRGMALLWSLAQQDGQASAQEIRQLAEAFGVPPATYGVGRDTEAWAAAGLEKLSRSTVTAPGDGWIKPREPIDDQ